MHSNEYLWHVFFHSSSLSTFLVCHKMQFPLHRFSECDPKSNRMWFYYILLLIQWQSSIFFSLPVKCIFVYNQILFDNEMTFCFRMPFLIFSLSLLSLHRLSFAYGQRKKRSQTNEWFPLIQTRNARRTNKPKKRHFINYDKNKNGENDAILFVNR